MNHALSLQPHCTMTDKVESASIARNATTVFDHTILPSAKPVPQRGRSEPFIVRRRQLEQPDSQPAHSPKRKHSLSEGERTVRFRTDALDSSFPLQRIDTSHSEKTPVPGSTAHARSFIIRTREQTPARHQSSKVTFDEDDPQIPKPPGEAGRPQRGGYNLQRHLKWPAKDFEAVKVTHSLNFFQYATKREILPHFN